MEPSSPLSETAQQLEQVRLRIAEGNPQLYRHCALYLQVLREGLASAVERACFHLAVEVHPQRYGEIEPGRRTELHRRIAALVRRSCTLLTVEQLQALAIQMQRRRHQESLRAQRQWLASLQGSAEADPEDTASAVAPQAGAPQGSVHLGLALPINGTLFGMEQGGPPLSRSARPADPPDEDADPSPSGDLFALFSNLLNAAAEQADRPSLGDTADGLLPTDPAALLRWLDALDSALARRLRNLSHALNVELVRLGLCSSLLPLRLLEAVAAGQVDSQGAPPNLVRLAVPLPEGPGEGLIETHALLIRPTDLEADQVRLRTCRTRLQQARQEIRRMAVTYQRLERRLQALEAEQLWLNDHSTAHSQRPQQPT